MLSRINKAINRIKVEMSDLVPEHLRNQRGAALMAVLLMVAIMGLGAGIAGMTWRTKVRQSKEQELLWRGEQYRKAIASYCQAAHGGAKGKYPRSLEVLLEDPRFLHPVRHLRRPYKDPLTGDDFVLIRNGAGDIIGVRSSSEQEPFKKDGFLAIYSSFTNRKQYLEWQFLFKPTAK